MEAIRTHAECAQHNDTQFDGVHSTFVDPKIFWTISFIIGLKSNSRNLWRSVGTYLYYTITKRIRNVVYGAFVTSTDSCSNPNWVPQRSVSYRRRRRNEFIAVDVGAFYWKFLSISYVPIDLGLRMEWEIKCSAVFVCCIVDIFFFLLHFINTIATYKYKVHKRNIVKYSCWTLSANWL